MDLAGIENPRWAADAACGGTPEHLWFAPGRRGGSQSNAAAARICRGCPVLGRCGTWTARLEGDTPVLRRYGVYAGLGPADRHRHRHTITTMTPAEYEDWYRTR